MTPKTQDQPANIAAPEVKGGSAATIGSAYYRLFEHMSRTHDLTLTVEASEWDGISCNDVDGMNWFDLRNIIVANDKVRDGGH